MTYQVVNASDWRLDQLAPYVSDVLCEMGRLAKRFPLDFTTEAMFAEFLSGKKTLWLVLDGEAFVSMAMSTVRTVDSTKTNIFTLCSMAGKDVPKYAAELCAAMEAAADKAGCPVIAVEGREGWKPLLARFGYKPYAVLFRKVK